MGEESGLTKMTFEANRVIFEEGTPGDSLFLITQGKVELRRGTRGADPQILEVLGKGDVFGEMALFTGKNRIATAVAVAKTEVIAISRDEFQKRVKAMDSIILSAVHAMAKRLIRVTQAMAQQGASGKPGVSRRGAGA